MTKAMMPKIINTVFILLLASSNTDYPLVDILYHLFPRRSIEYCVHSLKNRGFGDIFLRFLQFLSKTS